MDPHRNEAIYAKTGHATVANFTGRPDWRTRWPHATLGFGDFVADEFGHAMTALDYKYDGLASTKPVVNTKNVQIYRLGFFSKHPLGSKFWDECKKYTNPQRALF